VGYGSLHGAPRVLVIRPLTKAVTKNKEKIMGNINGRAGGIAYA